MLIQLNAVDYLMIMRGTVSVYYLSFRLSILLIISATPVWIVFNRGKKFLFILMVAFFCQLSIVIVSIVGILSGIDMDGLCTAKVLPLGNYVLFWCESLIMIYIHGLILCIS
jgi:hypothetical protein